MRLDLGIMAGPESKAFLVDLTKLVERMEKAAGIKTKTGKASAETESEEETETETEEEDDFGKKTAKKGAKFDADEEEETEEEESEEEEDTDFGGKKAKKGAKFDADETEEEETEEESEEEETKSAKGKKAKKVTQDDANDACKARVQRLIKKGQPGPEARKAVQKLLEKKFGTKSISEVEPKDFAKVVEVMSA